MNLNYQKMCGKHIAIYEAYLKEIDPKGTGVVEALTAAKFLKKSGLSDIVLSRVWDLSDPNGKGYLDRAGFFVALKLVSLAQAGQVANMSNIYTETINPPKVGDLPKIAPPQVQTVPVSSGGAVTGDWSISVIDRLKYEQLFESLKPVNGMLAGNKVKGVLMDSKLPMDILGKIWDLADQDKDGNLDKHEFIVAMHLVYQTLQKRTVPDVLPIELRKTTSASGGGPPPPKPVPPTTMATAPTMPRAPSGEGFGDGGFVANFPKDIAPPPAIPPLPATIPSMTRVPPVGGPQPLIPTDPLIPIGAPPSVTANADWVVTPEEMIRFEVTFRESDRDKDGLVSGLEVKNVFLQSGVKQNCLAHIWALCDTNQSGKLTLEQFALAMWMVERKQKGIEPPQVLTANMVPPSMRSVVSGVDLQSQEPKPTYSNPELEMISKEIEELAKERRALETEIAQKEADIRIKSGEVRSLQSELDTLSATLKQLENQRGEAQKRLDDLKAQVNKIREQCQKQEETINEQEGELNTKRSELQKLKDEEISLQKEFDQNKRELENLTHHLQNTQLQISSMRSMITQLMETERQMTDALLMCRAALSNQDAELVSEYQLKIEPDFDEARTILEKKIEEPKAADPFEDNNTTATKAAPNGFATNGFGNDPFGSNSHAAIKSGFDDSFTAPSGFDSEFDAFGSSAFTQQKDPFGGDAFSGSKPSNAITPEPGKDDFGSDPFAALHAPTGQGQVLSPNAQRSGPPPRPESPSPALPPKKSKVPPPRPAPPRPLQGPARPTQPAMDAFGSNMTSSGGSGSFADFADFDNKVSNIPPPAQSTLSFAPLSSSPTPALESYSSCDLTLQNSTLNPSAPIFTPTSSCTSTSITHSTNISNDSTRSPTPQQHRATPTTAPVAASIMRSSVSGSRASVISGPTDFSDDPFKDYRYEDPFNIVDPFADDGIDTDPEKMFKDDFSNDDDKIEVINKASKNQNVATSQPFNVKKPQSTLTNDFLDQFDMFNLNPSPVPSQKSSTSASGNISSGIGRTFSISSSNKSSSNTPIPALSDSPLDEFAKFDAFSAKQSNASSVGGLNDACKGDSINNNKANDSFFDAFNDQFNGNSNKTEKAVNSNVFDAFGDPKLNLDTFDAFSSIKSVTNNKTAAVTKSSKVFDDFNENTFEDDFFKATTTQTATNEVRNKYNNNDDLSFMSINNVVQKTQTSSDNFAKFDSFGDNDFGMNCSATAKKSINLKSNEDLAVQPNTQIDLMSKFVLNPTKLTKVTNRDVATGVDSDMGEFGDKLFQKFAADYSKPDTFDADLQEALKRSMMEK